MKLNKHRNQCGGCGEYFATLTAFDGHRVGKFGGAEPARRCLKPAEMLADGWRLGRDGFWRKRASTRMAGWLSRCDADRQARKVNERRERATDVAEECRKLKPGS